MTKLELQNQLSDLRNTLRDMGHEAGLIYVSHAIDCLNRGNYKATESWMRKAIERVNA